MKVKIECMECDFKVEADLKKGASITQKELESMASFFELEKMPNGYICKGCLKKHKEEKNV